MSEKPEAVEFLWQHWSSAAAFMGAVVASAMAYAKLLGRVKRNEERAEENARAIGDVSRKLDALRADLTDNMDKKIDAVRGDIRDMRGTIISILMRKPEE